MTTDNNHILIIGGGTAGWLSAAILAKSLNSKQADGVKITLVESPDIPILGVGEGTWPNLREERQAKLSSLLLSYCIVTAAYIR